ncbi:serine hydrolase domain-containing protein [Nemorincola caseinilytica]|uniref:Serine hydrolase domain-containing protein n=2 Tax=Nemorincola caseinilytica TaxID=2054315 RepID=A0ABP8NCZ1_9BACT
MSKKKMKLRSACISVLSVLSLAIACNSPVQNAAARTPGFDDPVKATVAPLIYDTLSANARSIIAQLDEYYRGQVRAGFNGAVLVGVKGKVVYERYFGVSNREKKMPVAFNSSSQLASISKTFTGAAILYLYEHKMLNIDYPVQHYIKDFPYSGISLRMLLNHRSGLPDYTKWVPVYNKDTRTPITNEAVVGLMVKHKPRVEFRPNTRFKYCNTNFALLARVIEVVSKMSYAEFMNKHIFAPLGMTNTFVYEPWKGLPGNATISYKYNWVREPDMFADGVTGDKGIYSTVQDMFRWDQSLYNSTLLSNEMIELSYGPCSFEKPGIKNYGLGWRMLCYPNGNKVIYHNGWWHGNNTSFYRLIKENMTIIVLGNRFNKAIYRQAPVIYGIVKGVEATGFDDEG